MTQKYFGNYNENFGLQLTVAHCNGPLLVGDAKIYPI